MVKGTNLKIVQTQSYDAEGAAVEPQVTSLAATHADAFVIGAALLACPAALNAMGAAGWHPITYMSGTCVSKLLFAVGGKNSDGVISVTPLLDPADPANASSPAMQLYKAQMKKYQPKADATDGIVAYGWSTAAAGADPAQLAGGHAVRRHGDGPHPQGRVGRRPAAAGLGVEHLGEATGSSVRTSG